MPMDFIALQSEVIRAIIYTGSHSQVAIHGRAMSSFLSRYTLSHCAAKRERDYQQDDSQRWLTMPTTIPITFSPQNPFIASWL